jgi:hypothetical protein
VLHQWPPLTSKIGEDRFDDGQFPYRKAVCSLLTALWPTCETLDPAS